jgi:hypothetical protein
LHISNYNEEFEKRLFSEKPLNTGLLPEKARLL